MNTPTITLTPRRQAVPAGLASTLEVLVRIGAPDAPETAAPARAPLHLALVIDRSGSMSGQPLEEAKKAAAFIVANLAAGDRAALVVFDAAVQTLVPLSGMDQRAQLLAAIQNIHSGGSTNLHGGWFAGAEALAPAARPDVISRVILLSDGCANHGLTEAAAIAAQCAQLAGTGVTSSTYGLGRDFNEELMIAMARAGQGNSYYGQAAEDLMDPFREEFALLTALCARKLELSLSTPPGVRVEVLNNYAKTASGAWRLPDLAYGAEAWALVRLTVPANNEQPSQLPGPSPIDLVTASVQYNGLDGEARAPLTGSLQVQVVPANVLATLVEDPLVVRRAGELEAAKLQEKARAAAQSQDWEAVDRLLAKAARLGADNTWIAGIIKDLKVLASRKDHVTLAKEAYYSSARQHTRLAQKDEPSDELLDLPAFLRRKTSQGKAAPPPPPKQP